MEPEVIAQVTISLPTVGGDIALESNGIYDDMVDVQIEQSKYGRPYCSMRLSPGGPCEFNLMGFTAATLDELGKFLIQSAKELTDVAERQKRTAHLFEDIL